MQENPHTLTKPTMGRRMMARIMCTHCNSAEHGTMFFLIPSNEDDYLHICLNQQCQGPIWTQCCFRDCKGRADLDDNMEFFYCRKCGAASASCIECDSDHEEIATHRESLILQEVTLEQHASITNPSNPSAN